MSEEKTARMRCTRKALGEALESKSVIVEKETEGGTVQVPVKIVLLSDAAIQDLIERLDGGE